MDEKGQVHTDLQPIDIAFNLHQNSLLWVDFDREPAASSEPILTKTFNFHPLAVDDALQESHYPKIDDWSDYLYIVLHAVALDAKEHDRVDTQELDIFLGRNYIVTLHDEPIQAIEKVWSTAQRDLRHMRGGVDHILYRIADEIASSYMPVVESFDETIDEIEAEIFDRTRSSTVEQIFRIKRSVLFLRRIIAPQREVLNKLARDDYEMIDESDRVYFRDVYDHLVRMYDITEGVRDLVSGTLDTYLSVASNRMNDVMKTLTIITTIFMPISFLAGFFGMNFFQPAAPLPAWTSMPSFMLTLAVMILAPTAMLIYFRRRGWMHSSKKEDDV
jgi:magnesium transporter